MKYNATKKVLSLLMAILMVVSVLTPTPLTSGNTRTVQAAETLKEAGSWKELRAAINAAPEGQKTVIEITQDFEANSTEVSDGTMKIGGAKTIELKAKDGDEVTIFRKEGDANFPMFEMANANGELILGEGLTLSGMTSGKCNDVEDEEDSGDTTTPAEFTVTWSNGSTTDEKTDSAVVAAGNEVYKNRPAGDWTPETGYEFVGWKFKTSSDGTAQSTKGNADICSTGYTVPADTNGSMKVVAEYERTNFIVTWSNGVSGDDEKTTVWDLYGLNGATKKSVGDNLSLTPDDDWKPGADYKFAGWKYVLSDGTEQTTDTQDVVDASGNPVKMTKTAAEMKIVAQWEKPGSGGGSGVLQSGNNKLCIDYTSGRIQLQNIDANQGYTEILNVEVLSDGKIKASSEHYAGGYLMMTGNGNPGLVASPAPTQTTYVIAETDESGKIKLKSPWPANKYFSGYATTWQFNDTGMEFTLAGASGGGEAEPYESTVTPSYTAKEAETYSPAVEPTYSAEAVTPATPATQQKCDGACKVWTNNDFNGGTLASPKGFFVEVTAGTLTIAGATLENFVTDKTVTNAAPVVAKGGTFKMEGGSIEHNSVGYVVGDNSYASKLPVNQIEGKVKGGEWSRTDTAGAVILTGGAKGYVSGGTIGGNRADTGAIIVQGDGSETKYGGAASELYLTGGAIDNNVGVHYSGGIYIYNGGYVQMGNEDGTGADAKLTNNFSWFKGGAVYASEEVFLSTKWGQPGTTKKVADAGFVMYDGDISNNMAISRAGAIEVMSDNVALLGGSLHDNASRSLGGAIYVEGDGVDRMYTLVVKKGCITNNTAVGYVDNSTLGRTFAKKTTPEGSPCSFENDLGQGQTQGTGIYDRGDYGGYYGNGGGIWLCSFGGNATFNISDNFNVIVDSNTAAGEGTDVQVHVAKGGSPNGVNIVSSGNNNFVNEKTGKPLEDGTHYPGKLSVKNNDEYTTQTCPASGGVMIYNNIASNGGGIAADGTIVFGDNADVYAPMSKARLTKTWAEGTNPSWPITLKYYLLDDEGNRIQPTEKYDPLGGYEVTFNGVADKKINPAEEEPGVDKYTENDSMWENVENGKSYAEMAIPWTTTLLDGRTVPTFTLKTDTPVSISYEDANGNTKSFNGSEFDPSNQEHIAALWQGKNKGVFDNNPLKIDKWNLEIVETDADGNEMTYKLGNEDQFVNLTAFDKQSDEFYDKANHHLATINTFPLQFNFDTEIINGEEETEEPKVEKYINNKVHQTLAEVDEEFTYSVMAYVPKDATEVTISDTLENTLEFVNKTPATVLDSVTVFRDNDHLGDGKGTVATGKVNGVDVTARNAATVAKNGRAGCPVTVDNETRTVTLTLDEGFINEVRTNANDKVNGEGFWVRVNFKAKYNTEELAKIKASYIGNDDLKAVEEDKLAYIKENGEVKWNASGNRYILLMEGVYYRSNVTTEGAEATSWEKHPDQNQWKTQFAGLKETDSKVIAGDVNAIPLPYNGYVLNAQNPHKGTPNQADYEVKKGNGSTSSYKTNIVTVDVEKPEVEKYVNNKVHADIVNFDQEFEYSVLAYVPEGATKVVISDTLNKDLEFIETDKTKVLTAVTIYKDSTHKGDGSGAGKDKVFDAGRIQRNERTDVANIELDGQTVSLTLEEAYLNEVRGNDAFKDAVDKGFWVKISFQARIKVASYDKLAEKIKDVEDGKANADATDTSISWEKVLNDASTIDKDGKSHSQVIEGKDVETDKSHAGIANKAEYKVTIGDQGESTYETNTVTVKPKTTKVYAKKTWKDEKGNDATWPDGVESVTVKVFRTIGEEEKEVGEITVKKDSNPAFLEGLPKLKNASYSAEEVAIPGYTEVGSVTGTGTEADPFVFTNQKNGGPQIEKYVNNKVHNDNEAFDTSFKYDIIVFVPVDADEIVIKDTLVNALEFAKAPENGTLTNSQTVAATASKVPGEVVTSIVVKDSNDHTVNGTVKNENGTALGNAAVPTINGQTLTVNIADATAYRGKYIQVTFWAKYTQEMIDAAKVGDSKTINGNGAVLGGQKSHTGTTNDATYDIRVGNEWTKDVKSNTVTVTSKTTRLEAEKKWKNADGTDAEWPEGVEKVEINVLKGKDVVATIELTAEKSENTSKELPVLVGVTYKLDEVEVPGYTTSVEGTVFTNKKQPNKPSIEKYINKDVDAHLVEFDKAFTYDILAFVPEDADAIEITDTLVGALEFAEGPVDETKVAVASTDVTKVVSAVVAKADNDHNAKGTVAGTDGTAVSGAECVINGQTLTVTIEDATAYRGQWIQVTFTAKYTQAAINAAKVANSETVKDNGTVISTITEHDGTANKASYKIKVGNEWSSDYESNTVTHDADTVKVEAEKQWKNADGTDAEWPEGVASVKVKVINDKTKKEVATITLTKAAPKASSKELPKLIGVTYSIKEVPVKGYISKVDGKVVTNTEGEGPEVEKYVEKDVTYDFDNFDQTFEYEIMGYITNDATEATFTDELNSVLEFVGNGNIKVYDMGTENDHKTTVAGEGTPVTATTAKAENGKLEVSFDEAAITPLRGKWVKVTFEARISEAGYQTVAAKIAEKAKSKADPKVAANDVNWVNIEDNGTVLIEKEHDGVPNQAKLSMKTQNNGDFDLDTNTVTVEPKTVELRAAKVWKNADGSKMTAWPTGAKVTFALMKGETEVETKTLSKAGTVTFTAQPKLDGVSYTVVEKSVEGIDALQDGDPAIEGNTWTFTNKVQPNKPSIEKYINKDVDAHLEEFDKAFTYDILAFVPEDADAIEITDMLVNALEFAEGPVDETKAAVASIDAAKVVSAVVAKAENNHKAKGTVAGTDGTAVSGAECVINGQTLTVTIADAKAYRGQWIQVTFTAKYTQATINAAKVADSQTVTDNGAVITQIGEHDGTANTASYKIEVGNKWSDDHKSNTVTHDAETVKVEAEKQWKNADGTAAQWPEGVKSVKVNVINDKTKNTVDTITLTKAAPKAESKELPKLIGVTYSIKEVPVEGYISKVDGKVVTNTEGEGPEVEKYVEKDVTYDFDNFDQPFEYEIMGYITNDATEATFTDELNSVLKFVGDGKIKVYDMGATNDHKTTVAGAGTEVTTGFTKSATDGKLTVSFDEAGITPLRGRWVKVTFEAQISEAGREAVAAKIAEKANSKADPKAAAAGDNWANIDDNGTVLIETKHDGVPNKAKLTMKTQNNGDFELDTNTVTVEPKTEELKATKVWKNADGSDMTTWPEGAKVTFALMKGKTEVETKTLSEAGTVTFTAQPKLKGVTYTVVEKSVEGIDALQDGDPTIEGNTWTFTNKKIGVPEIEKYINQNVHEFIDKDDEFTYDIIAYVTGDADKVIITDELNAQLQFVSNAADVKVYDLGTTNNHNTADKAKEAGGTATVATGTAITTAAVTINGRKLEVVIDNQVSVDAEAGTITRAKDDVTKLRGHYVRVEFKAVLTDAAKADLSKLKLEEIKENAPLNVTDAQKEHEGVANKASYEIEVGNEGKYKDESNTVTVKPEEPEIEKYVNKKSATGTAKDGGVHTDLAAFDEVYTYDIQAYIAQDATVAEITDELKAVLEFVGEAPTAVVIKAGEEGGKAPKLSKAGAAPQDAWSIDQEAWKAGKLVLTLGKADSTEVLKAAGQWIQITFDAKIKDAYRSIDALKNAGADVWTTVVENDPIDDAKVDNDFSGAKVDSHEGIANDTSYRMKKAGVDVDNTWSYNDKSNTVTVQPKTTKLTVSKEWKTGTLVDQWPAGAEVEVKLTQTKDGITTEVEGKTDKLTASKTTVIFADLPCLEGVTYGVAEGKVTNAGEYKIGEVKKVSEGVFKITNQREEEPEIEKYVNKKSASGTAKDGGVHTDLEAFYEVYTYDIQAYIAKDATVAEITDQLKNVLEFVGNGPTAVVIKAGEAYGKAPKLSKAGTAPKDEWSIDQEAWKAGKLVLTLGKADSTEVLKAAGQWIQITFDARIKASFKSIDALKKAGADVWQTIVENDPIDDAKVDNAFSGAKVDKHEGIANDSSYRMKKAGVDVGNTWSYNDKSNTVTVQPKTVKVSVNKTWIGKPADALRLALRRDGVIIETVTISAGSKWSYEWKSLPAGYKYEVTESVPANFTQTGSDTQVDKDGNVTVSFENTRTATVKINKTDLGGKELAGAEIVVKDTQGNEIASWTSKEGETMDVVLKAGDYVFIEVNAPEGYECVTTEIGFTVNGDGTVTVNETTVEPAGAVEVIDGVIVLLDKVKEFPVKINKTDMGGTELAGAVIEVKDANGKVIATWTSEEGKTMDLDLVPGEYTFREVNAPDGYECVTTEIGFTVDKVNGSITVTTNVVEPAGAVEVIDGVIILKDELKKEETTTETEEEETDDTEPDEGGSLPPGDEDESTTVNAETDSPSTEPETEPEGTLPPSDDEETTTVNAETTVPNTPPDTGDHSNLGLYIGLIAAAGVAGVGLLLATRKKKEEE